MSEVYPETPLGSAASGHECADACDYVCPAATAPAGIRVPWAYAPPPPGTPLERPESGIWSDSAQAAIDARDLSAELVTARQNAAYHESQVLTITAERDEARAELAKVRADLTAEIIASRKLQAERDRYRQALERCADEKHAGEAVTIAVAALGGLEVCEAAPVAPPTDAPDCAIHIAAIKRIGAREGALRIALKQVILVTPLGRHASPDECEAIRNLASEALGD